MNAATPVAPAMPNVASSIRLTAKKVGELKEQMRAILASAMEDVGVEAQVDVDVYAEGKGPSRVIRFTAQLINPTGDHAAHLAVYQAARCAGLTAVTFVERVPTARPGIVLNYCSPAYPILSQAIR